MSYEPAHPSSRQGLIPPSNTTNQTFHNNDINMEEIPMTQVRSHGSSTWKTHEDDGLYRNEGKTSGRLFTPPEPAGRRKLKLNSRQTDDENGEMSLTGLGKFYDKIVNFSLFTRYLVYVVPVAALIAIPIVIGATTAKKAEIGGVRILWFFTWIECVWLSIWVSKLAAKCFPWIFIFLCGVVSPGTRKYALILRRLEIPVSFVGWAIASIATFEALTSLPDNSPKPWTGIMRKILAAALIASCIYLAEKLIVQLISISYHQRSFHTRIQESKHHVYLLGHLYEASRSLFPMYCQEFAEEDYLISDSIDAMLVNNRKSGHMRSGSATPMRLIGGVGRIGDKLTSAFGNVASEITGKKVFNPTSAHSIVVEALEKKKSSEALARRLWMSFVIEGRESLSLEDIREVLGPARRDEADQAFASIDADNNGDISLDEMIMKIVQISKERKAIANSMHDIGGAISVLDSVLVTVAFVIVVFIFVAFLNANFVTTLATAGTTLLSMSFVFAVTCQEFLGSCIFLFIKHPYDVGDRVDIQGPEKEQLVVEQISLLYTVFKRIDYMKMVQVPNIVLNTMWIENVTRSKAMKEQLEVSISFDTTLEDIELLRAEMEAFVRHPDNSRDFQHDVVLECTGIGTMDKLLLKVEIRHKSNWSNETVRAARRSKFMCALVLALRKVPIYAPGGGGKPLGDPLNPTYSVTVTDEIAAAARGRWTEEKEGKRLVPSKKPEDDEKKDKEDTGKSTAVETGLWGAATQTAAAAAIGAHMLGEDAARDEAAPGHEGGDGRRSDDIAELRQGLLQRHSTKGRRKADMLIPPVQVGLSGTSIEVTPSTPLQSRTRDSADEEAAVGMYGGAGYGQDQQVPGGSYGMYPGGQSLGVSAPPPPRNDEFRKL